MILVGGAAMAALLRASGDSARELAEEVARFGELHGSLARLRNELRRAGDHVRDIRGR